MFPLKDNNPTERTPYVTLALIAANVLAYFLWQKGGISIGSPDTVHYQCNVVAYGAIPDELTHPDLQLRAEGCPPNDVSTWITPFTAMFMHGGLLHLGGNMLFLWIFGNNIEDVMGPVKFLIFYVLGGLVALAAQVAVDASSQVPTIGASGAIAAVLGGYLLLFPRARVVTVIFIVFFFTIVEIPALAVLGVWFVEQIWFGARGLTTGGLGDGGGVANFAHIGGFVFGLVMVKLFADRARTRRGQQPRYPVY